MADHGVLFVYAYDCLVVPGFSRQNSTRHQQPRKSQNHNLRSGRYHSHTVIKLNCHESGALCTLSLSDQTLMARDHVVGGFCASLEQFQVWSSACSY